MCDLIGPHGKQVDKNEVIFILGYDLLNKELKSISNDTDVVYSICGDLAIDFAYSEYNDPDEPLYECLILFVEKNILITDKALWKKIS